MDVNTHSKNMLTRLDPAKSTGHLNALSTFSWMVARDNKVDLHHLGTFDDPFVNFKIELNSCTMKRKCEDSSRDEGCETPLKRVCGPQTLSPDLGCFMDSSTPLSTQDSVSPSQIHESANSEEDIPHSLHCENILLNLASVFDSAIDDIMCLSPSSTDLSVGFLSNVESCRSPSSSELTDTPLFAPTVANGQEVERGVQQEEKGQKELKTEICADVDEGYLSVSSVHDPKIKRNTPQPVQSELPAADSSQVDLPTDKCRPETSTQSQAAKSERQLSLSADDLCPTVTDTLLKVKARREQSRQGSGENDQQQPRREVIPGRVKSKVVAVTNLEPPVTVRKARPVVHGREVDWEAEKRQYLTSVYSHLRREDSGGDRGVLSELQTLMMHVADQTAGSSGGSLWQHPSDLTRRNYQKRFNNTSPKMGLRDWQVKNLTDHKRFDHI